MNREELIKILEAFTKNNDFMLNPDKKRLDFVLDSLLKIEKAKGYRFCPCRLSDGSYEQDVGLLCPCNFKTHVTWAKEGRCWCGLFVKLL